MTFAADIEIIIDRVENDDMGRMYGYDHELIHERIVTKRLPVMTVRELQTTLKNWFKQYHMGHNNGAVDYTWNVTCDICDEDGMVLFENVDFLTWWGDYEMHKYKMQKYIGW